MIFLRKNKGITLVALAITIIILIILSLVTINLTIGNNGLITKAKEMQNYMINAQISDEELINQILEELEEEPENSPANEKLIIKVVDKEEAEYGNIIYIENVNIGIYTDASCTNLFKEIEIKNGMYETNTIPSKGTYFVKVKEAPPAYNIPNEALEFENKDIDENIWTIGLENILAELPSTGNYIRIWNSTIGGDINEPCRLNIENGGGINFSDESEIRIWKVADYDESNDKYVYRDNFARYPIEDINTIMNTVTNIDKDENTSNHAIALESYIYSDGIQPTHTFNFNQLPVNNILLDHGVFLLSIESVHDELQNDMYLGMPIYIETKDMFEQGTGKLCSEINLEINVAKVENITGEGINKTYRIKWEDEGNESARPYQLTAVLYRNDEVFGTFDLNKDNYWSYTVNNLSETDNWRVCLPLDTNKYIVRITEERNNRIYIILKYNTSENTPPEDIPPEEPPEDIPPEDIPPV